MSNQQGKASCWRIDNDHISHSASLLPWILSWRYGNRNFCPDRHSKHSQFQESWKRTHAHNLNQFCASGHKHTNIATDRNLVDAKKCTGAADLMPYCTQAWSNVKGWRGGLAQVQLCWILAKYSPLHHTSCSQIVHVRKPRFRLGGVSFLWHQFICFLVRCEIWFPLFIDTCMNFSIIFLNIWTDFWTFTVDRRGFSSLLSLL